MRLLSFLLTLFLMTNSCDDDSNVEVGPPTNLTLQFTVSPTNNGSVNFVAQADNAVSYEYDFGNGVRQTTTNGQATYRYWASGNYTVTVTAKSSGGKTTSTSSVVNVTVVLKLVWSDEFDTPGLPDATKWGYDLGAGGWGNNELQYYTNRSDNAVVANGMLKITLKKEAYLGSAYTSARLLSKDKYSVQYGKIEARAKLPAGVGTWPAIWMLGNNIGTVNWPACGEIDIMEHVGKDLNRIYGTLHHPGFSGGNATGGNTVIPNVTTEFHKYTVEWNDVLIKFSVDDVQFYAYNNTATLPFNQPFFLIMNIAMGGNFGGPAVDPNFTSASMEVDYIRVYQ